MKPSVIFCALRVSECIVNANPPFLTPHMQTLLDMPMDVLASICACCNVPTKMVRPEVCCITSDTRTCCHSTRLRLAASSPDEMLRMVQRAEATCKRLRTILAQPGDDRALWGTITVRVDDRGCPMSDTTKIVSGLAQRAAGVLQTWCISVLLQHLPWSATTPQRTRKRLNDATRYIAGIGAVIVRPASGGSRSINKPLHIMLFAIAGAIAGGLQGTHVTLEMRSSGTRLEADNFWPFLKKFWAAPTPNTQPGLTALAATLTRLEVSTQ